MGTKGDTRFKPGWEGGPGRPKGSVGGRQRLLLALDAVGAEPESIAAATDAFRAAAHGRELTRKQQRVLAFWKNLVVPLLPKEMALNLKRGFPSADEFTGWLTEVRHEADEKIGLNGNGEQKQPQKKKASKYKKKAKRRSKPSA